MHAILDVYGVEGQLGDYSFHGRTDPGIIRGLADLWGAGDPAGVIGLFYLDGTSSGAFMGSAMQLSSFRSF